jgi:hypothetical protein
LLASYFSEDGLCSMKYLIIGVFGISRCGEVEHRMRGPQRVRFCGINGTREVQHCSRVGFKKESTSQVLQKRFVKAASRSISAHKYDLLGASPSQPLPATKCAGYEVVARVARSNSNAASIGRPFVRHKFRSADCECYSDPGDLSLGSSEGSPGVL